MSIYIKLNKPIEGQKLLQQIEKLISGASSDSILVISTLVPQSTNLDLIKKLEHKKTPDDSGV